MLGEGGREGLCIWANIASKQCKQWTVNSGPVDSQYITVIVGGSGSGGEGGEADRICREVSLSSSL